MSGRSGAAITVVKSELLPHSGRLAAQYRWLQAHVADPGQVNVGRWLSDDTTAGYEMELLVPVAQQHGRRWVLAEAVISILAREVWSCAPTVHNATYTPEYLTRFPWATFHLRGWVDSLTFGGFCDTHGDPTLENVMARPDGQLVLIDPLPDAVLDRKVPSTPALDLGKLLQSALGYEMVRDGTAATWELDPAMVSIIRRACRGQNEWACACWCAALHIARLTPYQTMEHANFWRAEWPRIYTALRSISTEF